MNDQRTTRRDFLKLGAAAGATLALPGAGVGFGQTPFRGRLPKAQCTSAVSPDTIVVNGIGNLALLGIRAPAKDSKGYQKSLDAVIKYAANQEVLVDRGPKPTQTEDGRFRAMVYYREGGQWFNLNTKMLRAGLASAVTEPRCYVDTSGWAALVQEAKAKKRGLYSLGVDLPETAAPVKLAAAPAPKPPRPKPPATEGEDQKPTVPAYMRTYVKPEPVEVSIKYVGSILSKRFHRPNCVVQPKETDRVLFEGRLQALKSGYKPCVICRA